MNILIIGSGGREHAISWKVSKSNKVKKIFVVPGNPGIGSEDKVQLIEIKSPTIRIKLFDLAIKLGFSLPSIISPNAYVSKHSSLGKGVVVMHNAVINANASIGNNCIINSKALIEHDCVIAEHCHVSTNATINGGSQIEPRCFIGSNVTIYESIR